MRELDIDLQVEEVKDRIRDIIFKTLLELSDEGYTLGVLSSATGMDSIELYQKCMDHILDTKK